MIESSKSNNIYIGTTGYTTALYLRAASYVYSSKSITVSSDERLKTDFGPLDAYDTVFDALNPLTFRYRTGGGINMGFTYIGSDMPSLEGGQRWQYFE
ncbi:MAG: tail fiber domain-containing protein [Oscillospiraceae bacterium]|nr:tail fiber domain-containing protein [Oscillospiraceae bacterium]